MSISNDSTGRPDQLLLLRALNFDPAKDDDGRWTTPLPAPGTTPPRVVAKGVSANRVVRKSTKVSLFDTAWSHPIPTAAALALLLNQLADQFTDCIVLGEQTPDGMRVARTMPRKHASDTVWIDGSRLGPTLQDRGLRILVIDVDDWPLPRPRMTFAETAAYLVSVFSKRVRWLRDVKMVVQASSSVGTVGAEEKIKAHVFVLLSEPRTTAEMRRRLSQEDFGGPLDLSLYDPSHIIYTSRPEVLDGGPDPMQEQRVVIIGDPDSDERACMPLPDAEPADAASVTRGRQVLRWLPKKAEIRALARKLGARAGEESEHVRARETAVALQLVLDEKNYAASGSHLNLEKSMASHLVREFGEHFDAEGFCDRYLVAAWTDAKFTDIDNKRSSWSTICGWMQRQESAAALSVNALDGGTAPSVAEWRRRVAVDKRGRTRPTAPNLLLYFLHEPAWRDVFAYDERRNRPIYRGAPPIKGSPPLGEMDLTRDFAEIALWFQDHAEVHGRIHQTDLKAAVVAAAWRTPVDPLREIFLGLRGHWDGIPRLENVFQRIAGTPDTEWTRVVGKLWFTSLVARILCPGSKVDTMLILEGPQGFKKSSFFAAVMPDPKFFSDSLNRVHLDIESVRMVHSGPAIFEVGELSGLRKPEVEDIKAFLSAARDNLRPLYENYRSTERRCIFVGSTNRDDYLRDETGGRRFWPLKVTRVVDMETVHRERIQWFAEAIYRFDAGERWWLEGDHENALAAAEQDARYEEDIWFEAIARYLAPENRAGDTAPPTSSGTRQMIDTLGGTRAGDFVTVMQVAEQALKLEIRNAKSAEGNRITRILRKLGWIAGRASGAARTRGWRRPHPA